MTDQPGLARTAFNNVREQARKLKNASKRRFMGFYDSLVDNPNVHDIPFPASNLTDDNPSRIAWFVDIVLNLTTSLILFASFLAIFYFLITSRFEVMAVQDNTSRVVNELLQPLSTLLDDDTRKRIQLQLESIEAPDLAQADSDAEKKNQDLINQSAIVLGSAFGGLVVIFLVLYMFQRRGRGLGISISHIWKENLLLLLFVALTEFLFLVVVVARYRSVDANVIRRTTIDTFIDFIDK